jgi:hypothetical protein
MSVTSPALNQALKANNLASAQKVWDALSPEDRQELLPSLNDQMAESGGGLTVPMAQWLRTQGVDLSGMFEQRGVGVKDWLSQAIQAKNAELVTWLIQEQGVDPNRPLPNNGPTPLIEALQSSRWGMAEQLLNLGASLSVGNWAEQTPLHVAAANYNVRGMVWLMEHGADPTLRDQHNHCPAELIPQDPGAEWRPDDTYDWLTACEAATSEERKVIPDHIRDEFLVEKIGLKFMGKPEEEWTDEDRRVQRVLIERGVIEAPEPEPPSSRRSLLR